MSAPGAPTSPADLRAFASDNYAGVHPDVWAAMLDADAGHARAYGEDPVTAALQERVRATFGERAFALPVFNGTGANVVALRALTPPWGAVVCASHAHIATDEGGAPVQVGGLSLLPVPTGDDGKLTPALLTPVLGSFGFVHAVQPAVVEIAQATEVGTVYSAQEVRALADAAHAAGLSVYMDGARLCNAAAALGVPLREFTTDAGVDAVSFGGTKNGALGAEAVVVLNPDAVATAAMITDRDVPGRERDADSAAQMSLGYLRKSSMQLASKQRYLSAQLLALLTDDLGVRLADHANAMARLLAERVSALEGVELSRQPEANAVFAVLDPAAADAVRALYPFYDWNPATGEVRWMTSWDTSREDVAGFTDALGQALAARR